jgi:hypothetical protein
MLPCRHDVMFSQVLEAVDCQREVTTRMLSCYHAIISSCHHAGMACGALVRKRDAEEGRWRKDCSTPGFPTRAAPLTAKAACCRARFPFYRAGRFAAFWTFDAERALLRGRFRSRSRSHLSGSRYRCAILCVPSLCSFRPLPVPRAGRAFCLHPQAQIFPRGPLINSGGPCADFLRCASAAGGRPCQSEAPGKAGAAC